MAYPTEKNMDERAKEASSRRCRSFLNHQQPFENHFYNPESSQLLETEDSSALILLHSYSILYGYMKEYYALLRPKLLGLLPLT
jgi:hypothetical protein